MIISPTHWAMLFIIPAVLTFLAGNIQTSILMIVIGAVFGLGFWVGYTKATDSAG